MPRWTAASREKQRRLINRVRPWQHSTGPTSEAGKRQSARNGCNHAPRAPGTHPKELRRELRYWWGLLRLQRQMARWGLTEPDDVKKVCVMILSIEHDLGVPQSHTERRLIRALRAQTRQRF
jgi:hypothetical protein